MGSDLPSSRDDARDRLIRCGGTLITFCPAANRSRSSRAVSERQSSTPHTTAVPKRARTQRMASVWDWPSVPMVFCASLRPSWSTATRVWVRRWASTPTTTSSITRSSAGDIGLVEMLDVERQLRDGQEGLARAQANAAIDLVSLYKSLGGGWSMPQVRGDSALP